MKYDNHTPHPSSKHARRWTIGMLKAARLIVKNARRAKHGLPPKEKYSEI
jgi:hypothetical protein